MKPALLVFDAFAPVVRLQPLSDGRHAGSVRACNDMANIGPAIELADRVYIFDNSVDGADARLCARTHDAMLRRSYGAQPPWVSAVTASLQPHPSFAQSA